MSTHRYDPDTGWREIPETPEDQKIRKELNKKAIRDALLRGDKYSQEIGEPDASEISDAELKKLGYNIGGLPANTTYYKPEPPCHTDGKVIFQAHGIRVRASAGSKGIHNIRANELLLDLLNGDVVTGPLSIRTGQSFGDWIQPHLTHRLRIDFNWPDMSALHLPKQFWMDLIQHCKTNKYDIHVACHGGHGRTGTVLAILAGLMGVTKADPVEFIRNKYCKRAVESASQISLVQKITGLKVTCQAEKFYGGYDYSTTSIPSNKGITPLPPLNSKVSATEQEDLPVVVCTKCNMLLATSQTKCTCGGELVSANLDEGVQNDGRKESNQ